MADPSNKPAAAPGLHVVIPLDPILHVDLMAAAAAAGVSAAEHARNLLVKGLREPDAPDIGPALDQAAEAMEGHLLSLSEAVGGLRGLAGRRAAALAASTGGAPPPIPEQTPCSVTGHTGPNGGAAPGGGAVAKAGAAAPTTPQKPHVSGRPVPASRADVRARYKF